jgi:hypothetical protein
MVMLLVCSIAVETKLKAWDSSQQKSTNRADIPKLILLDCYFCGRGFTQLRCFTLGLSLQPARCDSYGFLKQRAIFSSEARPTGCPGELIGQHCSASLTIEPNQVAANNSEERHEPPQFP